MPGQSRECYEHSHNIPVLTTCNTEFTIAMPASSHFRYLRFLRPLRVPRATQSPNSTCRAMDFGTVVPGPGVDVGKVSKLAQRVEAVLHEKPSTQNLDSWTLSRSWCRRAPEMSPLRTYIMYTDRSSRPSGITALTQQDPKSGSVLSTNRRKGSASSSSTTAASSMASSP